MSVQTRVCRVCGVKKPIDNFDRKYDRQGEQYVYRCKPCRRAHHKLRRERKRIEAALQVETMRTCLNCGTEKPIEEFPFHGPYRMYQCDACKRGQGKQPLPATPSISAPSTGYVGPSFPLRDSERRDFILLLARCEMRMTEMLRTGVEGRREGLRVVRLDDLQFYIVRARAILARDAAARGVEVAG